MGRKVRMEVALLSIQHSIAVRWLRIEKGEGMIAKRSK